MTATDVPLDPGVRPRRPGTSTGTSPWTGTRARAARSSRGVDLAAELDDDVVAEIRRALLDHQVIFFREQSLTPEQQVAFSRRFGPYSPVPFVEPIAGHPEVIAVVREPSEQTGLVFGGLWHSDFSFLAEPPMGSILHAIEVPPYGADTIWANQYLAYRGLSRAMRGVVRAAPRRAQRGERVLAEDAVDPRPVRGHDRADERRRQPHAGTSGRAHARGDRASPRCSSTRSTRSASPGSIRTSRRCLLDHLFQHSTQHGTRAGGSGRRATSRSGTTAACSTW